jgi:hypothetical protein
MPEMTDEQLAGQLRAALAGQAMSVEIADASERVARARVRATRSRATRPWGLAGIAAALVLALVATAGFAAWNSRPTTGGPGATATETAGAPTDELGSPLATYAPAGHFVRTGDMTTLRQGTETATLLLDGRVLIVGGDTSNVSAELYDPRTETFSGTGSMGTPRIGFSATLLADGRVLIAGGTNPAIPAPTGDAASPQVFSPEAYASAEIYDPSTGRFSPTGSMAFAQSDQVATSLADGRVLLTGGWNGSGSAGIAQLYDPGTGKFSATGKMTQDRTYQSATLLPNGRVLIVGGSTGPSGDNGRTTSAELYDPETGTFTQTDPLPANAAAGDIMRQTATLLREGRVLIVGGCPGVTYCTDMAANIYDSKTGKFSPTGSMPARREFTATLLSDGRVLIAGGTTDIMQVTWPSTEEIYDPATGTFSPIVSLRNPERITRIATLLQDGRVLIAGGAADTSAELYVP